MQRRTSTSETFEIQFASEPTVLYHVAMQHRYSVYQRRGEGNFIVSFINPSTGKKTNRSTGTAVKRQAYRKAEQIVAEAFDPPEIEDVHKVGDLLDQYEEFQLTVRRVKPGSAQRTRGILNEMCNVLVATDLDDLLDPESINGWLRSFLETLAPNTVRQKAIHVIGFYHWMQEKDIINVDIAKKIDRIQTREADRKYERGVYTDEEYALLWQYLSTEAETFEGWSPQDRLMAYKLASGTGLRRGELSELLTTDVVLDDERPHIRVRAATSKNGKTARQFLPSSLVSELAEFLKGKDGRVFTAHPASLSKVIKYDLKGAGIEQFNNQGQKRDIHAMRHTYITRLIERGADIKTVQLLARHANPSLTLAVYAKSSDERLADAANLLNGDLP